MAIDEKALDELLNVTTRDTGDMGEIPPEVRKALDRIWAHNDALRVKKGPGYINKRKAAWFLRAQGIRFSSDMLAYWARLAGRFSWDQK